MKKQIAITILCVFAFSTPARAATAEAEGKLWNKVKDSKNKAAFEAYLNSYPSGPHSAAASAKLKALNEAGITVPAMVRIPGKNYEIGKYLVTQKEYLTVMGLDYGMTAFPYCGEECPADNIPLVMADEKYSLQYSITGFLTKLNQKTGKNYRLPTESEWEYACYGGSQTKYCGGNDVDAVAWHDTNSKNTPHPIGQKQANGYGLYDMSGNLWEWMSDSDNAGYGRERHILRGGSWQDNPQDVLASNRIWVRTFETKSTYGFRLARTINENSTDAQALAQPQAQPQAQPRTKQKNHVKAAEPTQEQFEKQMENIGNNVLQVINARETCRDSEKPCDQVTIENKILDVVNAEGAANTSKNDFDKDAVQSDGEKLRAELSQMKEVKGWVCKVDSIHSEPIVNPKNSLAIKTSPRRGIPEDECVYSQSVKAVIICHTAMNPALMQNNAAGGNIHLCVTNTDIDFAQLSKDAKIVFSGALNSNPESPVIQRLNALGYLDKSRAYHYSHFDNGIDINGSVGGSGWYGLHIDNATANLLKK